MPTATARVSSTVGGPRSAMRPYLDTAVVLTLSVGETTSEAVAACLAKRRQPLAFSDWGLIECASALGIKHRRGELPAMRCIWR